jgi:ABC-type uncharacterized transport system substrate-binding protein
VASKTTRSYFFQNSFQKLFKRSSSKQWDSKAFSRRKTVYIIRPNNSKEVSQIVQGVVNALMDCIERLYIIPVVGDNNVKDLTMLLYDIVRQYPTIDMIFSLGRSSTRIIQKVMQDFGGNIPVFFIGVDQKTASQVMKYNSNITGVTTHFRNYADQFKHFFYFTQHDVIKKVLVPCARFSYGLGSAYVNEDSSALISFLTSQKIEAKLVEITCSDDLYTKIKPLLSNVTLLALSRDHVLETYAHELITMANEQRVPLFSSSFEAIEQGAAVSFGKPGYKLTKESAVLAKPILACGVVPPVQTINWIGTMGINRDAAQQQSLKLNMERLCAAENVVLL